MVRTRPWAGSGQRRGWMPQIGGHLAVPGWAVSINHFSRSAPLWFLWFLVAPLVCPTGCSTRAGLSDEKGWEKRNRRLDREAHTRTCACSSIGRWEPAKEWARRERERATLAEKERTYATARHCTVLGEPCCAGKVLWAFGPQSQADKRKKIEPRDGRTTTGYAQPGQTGQQTCGGGVRREGCGRRGLTER